jgi:hypothetical protein
LTEGTGTNDAKPEGEAEVKPTINADTGEGVPGWTLRIEGRLLDVSGFFVVLHLGLFSS